MIDKRPPNFEDALTNSNKLIYKHINHDVWLYPGRGHNVYISADYIDRNSQGRMQKLSKEEYDKLLIMLDAI